MAAEDISTCAIFKVSYAIASQRYLYSNPQTNQCRTFPASIPEMLYVFEAWRIEGEYPIYIAVNHLREKSCGSTYPFSIFKTTPLTLSIAFAQPGKMILLELLEAIVRKRTRLTKNKKIRYAVVGLGHTSQLAVLPAFARAGENSQLTSLVSGAPKKLLKYSAKYLAAHSYTYDQYADCLNSGEIDAVYLALPCRRQRAYAELAARAGVHILCEKPMALDEADCEAMIAATEEAGVKFMTAYPLHFESVNLHAVEIIKSGKIGDPRIFTSIFSKQANSGASRVKKSIEGRALYDMELSCINAARYLFGAEPLEVFAWNVTWRDQQSGQAPEITSGLLKYPNDRIASFTTSFGASERSYFEVIGTKGRFRMEPAFELDEDLKSEITIDDWRIKEVSRWRNQFASELVYFSDCILNNRDPEPSGQQGLADVRIVQALLKSVEINQPVPIRQVNVGKLFEMHQYPLHKAVSQHQMVRAGFPGADY